MEPPLDLVPSFLQAIILMQLFGALAMLSLLRRLSALKRNVEPRVCASIVTIYLAATAALPDLFGAAKHFCTKNADGELYYKY